MSLPLRTLGDLCYKFGAFISDVITILEKMNKKNKFPFPFLTYPLPSPIHISDKAEGKEEENFLVIYYEYWLLCQTN